MKIKVVECLEWKAPNRPGELLRFAAEFKEREIDLDILLSCGGSGLIAAAAKKPAQLRAALKAMGVKAEAGSCFYLTGKDKAGALVKVLRRLAKGGLNVLASTAVAAQGRFGALIWVKDSDLAKAGKLLKA